MRKMKKPRNTNEETQFQPVRLLLGAMVMGSSRAIEHQEAQGQRELVNSESLPVRMNGGKPILESLGFKFGKHDGKDLFIECEMPTGWKKVGTDHSMWSNLLDDKGRVRANIFYKAAFIQTGIIQQPTGSRAVMILFLAGVLFGVAVTSLSLPCCSSAYSFSEG